MWNNSHAFLGAQLCIKRFVLTASGSVSINLKNIPATIYVSGQSSGLVYGTKLEFSGTSITSEANTSSVISYSLSTAGPSSKVLTINNSGSSAYNIIVIGNTFIDVVS